MATSASRTSAWLFPGQGSQYVGMGQALARADESVATTIRGADEILGIPLSDIIFNGPESELIATENQQPAIVTISTAYFLALRERNALPEPEFVAGHSLGEYSALIAAGALGLSDGLRLVRRRGELMREHGTGSMAAIIGLEGEVVDRIAGEAGAEVANHNAPGQITISGRTETVERAVELASAAGARRALMLPVNGAFHSSLMAPVVDGMRPLIEATHFTESAVPLVTNVDARPIRHPDDLRTELLDQICAPVRWVDVVTTMSNAGVTHFHEIGPGKVLSGLVQRISRGAVTTTAESLLQASPARTGSHAN